MCQLLRQTDAAILAALALELLAPLLASTPGSVGFASSKICTSRRVISSSAAHLVLRGRHLLADYCDVSAGDVQSHCRPSYTSVRAFWHT